MKLAVVGALTGGLCLLGAGPAVAATSAAAGASPGQVLPAGEYALEGENSATRVAMTTDEDGSVTITVWQAPGRGEASEATPVTITIAGATTREAVGAEAASGEEPPGEAKPDFTPGEPAPSVATAVPRVPDDAPPEPLEPDDPPTAGLAQEAEGSSNRVVRVTSSQDPQEVLVLPRVAPPTPDPADQEAAQGFLEGLLDVLGFGDEDGAGETAAEPPAQPSPSETAAGGAGDEPEDLAPVEDASPSVSASPRECGGDGAQGDAAEDAAAGTEGPEVGSATTGQGACEVPGAEGDGGPSSDVPPEPSAGGTERGTGEGTDEGTGSGDSADEASEEDAEGGAGVVEIPSPGGPFADGRPYVDPQSLAARAADAAETTAEAEALRRLAEEGAATWVTGGDPVPAVAGVLQAAAAAGQTPVFVAYNIPQRDCALYSSGGAADAEEYRGWVESFAGALSADDGAEDITSVVILEPDALAGMDCLDTAGQEERTALLAGAGQVLSEAGATVYLDAGGPGWQPVDVIAERLQAAGLEDVRGFALNTSGYATTAANQAYGDQVVAATGGQARYVIDTSRNGAGPLEGAEGEDAWCNPPGRALGEGFTTETGNENNDALLYVKVPGDSDGECGRTEPAAGQFWPERALELAGAAG